MKTVYFDIDDRVLKQSLSDLFTTFGFKFTDEKQADFVIKDLGDRIVVNGDNFFVKPIDIFSMINDLSKNTDLCFDKLTLKIKSKIAVFEEESISLTDIETKILSSLMSNKDGISSVDLSVDVFSKVNESCLKSLATHVYNLKKKLETITKKQKNIVLENSRYSLDLK